MHLREVYIHKCWAVASRKGHNTLRFDREHTGIHHKDPLPDVIFES